MVSALLHAGDQFALEMAAGLIPVRSHAGSWTLTANAPSMRPMAASTSDLAAMLNLPPDAILSPTLWVDCGTEQPMIALSSVAHVQACRPDPVLLARFSSNRAGHAKAYVFARTEFGFETRYFWLSDKNGLQEDPGTGSACANLGGWWMANYGSTALAAKIHQGTLIDRPNVLTLRVKDGAIQVGGKVSEIGSGVLHW